jgi:NitT/TauT family transport system substrate-binding protein
VDIVSIGAGRSGIASIERGVVDAASVATAELFRLRTNFPDLVVLADSSTPQGSKAILGSEFFPAIAALARADWLERNPDRARKIVRALNRTIAWMRENTPEKIRERMPAEFITDNAAGDLETLRVTKTLLSVDGVMPPGGPEAVRNVLAATQEKIRTARIDLSTTYTNNFVLEKQ